MGSTVSNRIDSFTSYSNWCDQYTSGTFSSFLCFLGFPVNMGTLSGNEHVYYNFLYARLNMNPQKTSWDDLLTYKDCCSDTSTCSAVGSAEASKRDNFCGAVNGVLSAPRRLENISYISEHSDYRRLQDAADLVAVSEKAARQLILENLLTATYDVSVPARRLSTNSSDRRLT